MFVKRPLIAIDIGTSSVKIAELHANRKSVKRLGYELIPPGIVDDGEVRDSEAILNIIRRAFHRIGIVPKGRHAALSLGGSGILIKRGMVTPVDDSDLDEQCFHLAEQFFESDLNDMYFRGSAIGKAEADGRTPVILVGAKRELVEQQVELIHALGMRTGLIDSDVISIANMFDYNFPLDNTLALLVNVGHSLTHVILLHNGQFLFSRSVDLGGGHYSQRIAQELGVEFDKAEALKLMASQGDQSVAEEVRNLISETNESLAMLIQESMNFFFQQDDLPENVQGADHAFLVGGGARTLGLDAAIAATLSLPIQIVSPFHRVDANNCGVPLDYILQMGPIFGNCVGLALRTYNDAKVRAS